MNIKILYMKSSAIYYKNVDKKNQIKNRGYILILNDKVAIHNIYYQYKALFNNYS